MQRRPDLQIGFLRGNVNTRLAKLDAGEFDAIILACAGLKRLGFDDRIGAAIDEDFLLPAGGQGAVGIEYREADSRVAELLAPLAHEETSRRVIAERTVVRRLDGGCDVPIASFAVAEGDSLGCALELARLMERQLLSRRLVDLNPKRLGSKLPTR